MTRLSFRSKYTSLSFSETSNLPFHSLIFSPVLLYTVTVRCRPPLKSLQMLLPTRSHPAQPENIAAIAPTSATSIVFFIFVFLSFSSSAILNSRKEVFHV